MDLLIWYYFFLYPVLQPYKYSGYPMLMKTIQLETSDSQLFDKETALLPAACELAYHTVNCSALNAEELRREQGIEVWLATFKIIYCLFLILCNLTWDSNSWQFQQHYFVMNKMFNIMPILLVNHFVNDFTHKNRSSLEVKFCLVKSI